MTSLAPQIHTKTVSEVLTASFGFATKLGTSGALLTGTPTVAVSPSGPTISSIGINDAAITIAGVAHAISEAVQCLVSGGTAGTTYTLTCTATTDDSQTLQIYAIFIVET